MTRGPMGGRRVYNWHHNTRRCVSEKKDRSRLLFCFYFFILFPFSILFRFHAGAVCSQEDGELACRIPDCMIGRKDEASYALVCLCNSLALGCVWLTLCLRNSTHAGDERLYDRAEHLLRLGLVLCHVEVCHVCSSHRCRKSCYNYQLH